MKSTGIVRKVDELGRIVIPMELRKTLGIGEKDPVEIYTEGEMIIFKKYQPFCGVCKVNGELHPTLLAHGIKVCRECVKKAGGI